ncbi:hypothetical protein NPX13_g3861 [Xylaria arbuscula]|uniref:Uncharacterized protein n=1 Tax=Xylaria arbuscula TaxID=114810 RepID=A0A9W8NGH5_9PEZI|nr:hypothetical protein NPX13_g3861 [Xylaria arbuscula]
MVRLRRVPPRARIASAPPGPRDDVRVQEVQEVLPQGRAGVRGGRRVLPALRQPLRHRGRHTQALAACRGRGREGGQSHAEGRTCQEYAAEDDIRYTD